MNNPFRRQQSVPRNVQQQIKEYVKANTPAQGELHEFNVDILVAGHTMTVVKVKAMDVRQACAIAHSKIDLKAHKSYAK